MSRFGSDSLTMALSSCATADICAAKAMLPRRSYAGSVAKQLRERLRRLGGPCLPLMEVCLLLQFAQVCEMQPILTIALCCSVRDGDDLCGAQQNTLEQPCWSHVPVAPVRCAGIWARAPLRLRGSGTFDGAGEDSPQRCVCAQREPVRSRAPHAHGQGHALTFGGRGTDPNH
jgi:hypothetical protein